jgi:hypothetical protein
MAQKVAGRAAEVGIITYCDQCGVLVRGQSMEGPILCPECRAGRKREPRRSRDSGRIPYSQSPSPESILDAINTGVRLGVKGTESS